MAMIKEQVNKRLQQDYINMCQAIKEDNELSATKRFIRANCDYIMWGIMTIIILIIILII